MALGLRAVLSVLVLPASAALVIPWVLLRQNPATPVATWLGAIPISLGFALFAWCVVLFAARGRGTLAPWDPPRTFVPSGPYRVVRNPMYVGVGTVILGEAILFGSWALATYFVVIAVIWHLFVVVYEEPTLERAFGDDYRAYRARVPRWLPRISRP